MECQVHESRQIASGQTGDGNVDILVFGEVKWMGKGEFNLEDNLSTTVGKNPSEEMEKPSVYRRVWNAVLGCSLKNDRMISVCFQGKPFYITGIQVYAPISNTEEAEVEQFYEDL